MPTYLCHGFRWHRRSIRVYVVVQNIDDAAPEWIIAPDSSPAILESFYSLFNFLPEPPADLPSGRHDSDDENSKKKSSAFRRASKALPRKTHALPPPPPGEFDLPPPTVPPEEDDVLQNSWSAVKLLEEYDPQDLGNVSRPYAYVADYVVRVDLSSSVVEEITRYEENMAREKGEDRAMGSGTSDEFGKTAHKKGGGSGKKAGWFEKLRDQLQRGEDIRWYVVVCGDEEREAPEEKPRTEPLRRELQFDSPRQRSGSASQGVQMDRPLAATLANYQRETAMLTGREGKPAVPQKDYPLDSMHQKTASASSREPSTPASSTREWHTPALSQGQFATPRTRQGEFSSPAMSSREFGNQPQRKMSMDFSMRPKTPKGGGLRRIFGRKHDEGSP